MLALKPDWQRYTRPVGYSSSSGPSSWQGPPLLLASRTIFDLSVIAAAFLLLPSVVGFRSLVLLFRAKCLLGRTGLGKGCPSDHIAEGAWGRLGKHPAGGKQPTHEGYAAQRSRCATASASSNYLQP